MDVGLVCDSCHGFSPLGATACGLCAQPISLDPRRRTAREIAAAAGSTCPACHSHVAAGHKFCFNCGHRMPEFFAEETRVRAQPLATPGRSTMFFGAAQAPRARLTLIRGDGLDGISYALAGDEHLAGRIDCPLLFADDRFLSPTHANFFYRAGNLVVRDEGSLNGVYRRISGSAELRFGARFLVGEQVIAIEAGAAPVEEPTADGTYVFSSPRRASAFRVVQLLRGGQQGLAVSAEDPVLTIGREGNDINFPDDPFISGHHAQISAVGGRIMLADLSSRNGTFVRIVGEVQLEHGDYVFMGQQLLRIEIV